MKGDIDYQNNHVGEYVELPVGRGEVEVAFSGKESAHGPVFGVDETKSMRLFDTPQMCRYCQVNFLFK
jgi:hypothetical protein